MILVPDGPDRHIKAFIERGIPRCRERGLPDAGQAIGVVDEKAKRLIGGIYYHDFDPDAGVIEMSAASLDKRWLTRKTLYGLFAYPFIGLGCQLVAARHSANDAALARIFRAYGFQQVTIPRLFGRNEDAIVSTLTIESWRTNGFHKEA